MDTKVPAAPRIMIMFIVFNIVVSISKLFSREFIILVILANLVSWPVGFFATRRWLQAFPYQVSPSVLPYLIALAVTLAIAYGSMLYHTYKASLINPADSLRHE